MGSLEAGTEMDQGSFAIPGLCPFHPRPAHKTPDAFSEQTFHQPCTYRHAGKLAFQRGFLFARHVLFAGGGSPLGAAMSGTSR